MYVYDHKKVEKKWQDRWEKEKLYTPNLTNSKNKFYNLWMFPYPSAEGLHAGHAFASTGSDIYGRFMRMNGMNVFQPFGYDSFGIHSENYAIKINENPNEVVKRTTKHYEEQMKSMGHGYDWTKTVTTSDPDYYKWTQWLFIKMYKKGLAYKNKASVNFCPSCKTVLADEQVMSPSQAGKEPKDKDGKIVKGGEDLKVCERCGTLVLKKDLDQWFFKITDYADRLLSGLNKINWSERVKIAQKAWIGKSEGMIINFKLEGNKDTLSVFTTRPDTLDSATFIAKSSKELDTLEESKEKLGKFTGFYAINPINGRRLAIWETNYVEGSYGTGVIMGVPAYDERDMDFAKKYGIDIVKEDLNEILWKEIKDKGWGEKNTNYHLRDWLVSRQRYWGAPIPMVNCSKCGWQTVSEDELPILLPNISDYKPEGTGKGPLANHPDFYKTKCPKCEGVAIRETDVMDTFVDSSWYFLRYPSVGIEDKPFDKEITKKWLPVDLYFGGAEHSVLHLMYARFVTMVLSDLGLVSFEEPFPKFFAHGLMIKDGAKMSKSRGNVVNPDEYIEKYGADTLRLYVMFMGPMDGDPDFRDTGIEVMQRFTKRVWNLFHKPFIESEIKDQKILYKMHQTIIKVTKDIQEYKYNTAIAAIMEYVNVLTPLDKLNKESLMVLAKLLAPFAPHITEELWIEILDQKGSIHITNWPRGIESYTKNETITIPVQVNGKLRGQIVVESIKLNSKEEILKLAKEDIKVAKWLKGGKVKKEIFILNKLVNFVV
ncbi:MAG: class I tRNA ligase family protein [Candidatus Woesebacteria bacterium]|nr:class I tRNA ligase family protein [Candidatus Woesebacteria bacterium]